MIILVVVALIALGNWQLRRLDWKLDLIERIESRAYSEPVASPSRSSWSNINKQEHEYLRVTVQGQFNHKKETLVWAATERGNGYWVLTPLYTDKNEIILINRGFVPLDKADQATRRSGLVTGDVLVTGLLRLTEPKGIFLRQNDSVNDRWYSRDVAAIAKSKKIEQVAPFFIDADAIENSETLPVGGMTRLNFRNPHLVYAITWYGLAILLLFMTYKAVLRKDIVDE